MRATWAPRGKTPTINHRFNWKRLSSAATIAYEPDGSDAFLVFQMQAGAYNDESLIEYLLELREHLGGRKATLLWDGLPSHRSRKMKTFIASQRNWLIVERMPAYAPDLNPVESLWGNLKSTELANLCAESIYDAEKAADTGLERIGGDAQLCFAFLRHTGLSL